MLLMPVTSLAQDTILVNQSTLSGLSNIWTSSSVYLLEGPVYFDDGILIMLPGTQILAKGYEEGITEPASLTIGPAASLLARGRADSPICFSAASDLSLIPGFNDGLWAGLRIEADESSSISILEYISVAFAGAPTEGQTGAALQLLGVDDRTRIEHIEVIASAGDGIQIRGGEAEIAFATVSFVKDDAFDWDHGWTGKGIYWFAYQLGEVTVENNVTDFSFGIEGKGNIGPNGRVSHPQIFNATIVGQSCPFFIPEGSNFRNEGAIYLTDNTAGLIANSLFVNFPNHGISVQDLPQGPDSRQQLEDGNIRIANNVWWSIGSGHQFDAGPNGIILVPAGAEDPAASFLATHLTAESNIYEGVGIRINRSDNTCFALDPRPDQWSPYFQLPNLAYPSDAFYATQVQNEQQKGAFALDTIWAKTWTKLDQSIFLGEEAKQSFTFKGVEIIQQDTLYLDCEELVNFHELVDSGLPCFPQIILIGSAGRRGNKRRPSNKDLLDEEPLLAFIEDWEYVGFDYGCHLPDTVEFTLIITDTVPPVIHPIPDGDGGLTAFATDCDEAWITAISTDTVAVDGGVCISYTFIAEDYAGNTSTLSIEKKLLAETITVYPDLDGDGFGNPHFPMVCSTIPPGFVDNDLDCNDDDPGAFNSLPCENSADDCFGAIQIPVETACHGVEFNMFGQTPTIYPRPEFDCGVVNVFRDVWVQFTAPFSGSIILDLQDSSESEANGYLVELFEGSCKNLNWLACFEGYTDILEEIKGLSPGATYFLRIYESVNIGVSEFNICLQEGTATPANDNCLGATTINATSDNCTTQIFSNVGASAAERLAETCALTTVTDVWFKVFPPAVDSFLIRITPSDTQQGSAPGIVAYYGPCDDLTYFAHSCDLTSEGQSDLLLENYFNGEAFWLQIIEDSGIAGTYTLSLCPSTETTVTATTDSAKSSGPTINCFPNPTTDQLNLHFRFSVGGLGSATIMDFQGRTIRNIFKDERFQNGQVLRYSVEDLAPGLYFVQLQTASGSYAESFMVVQP